MNQTTLQEHHHSAIATVNGTYTISVDSEHGLTRVSRNNVTVELAADSAMKHWRVKVSQRNFRVRRVELFCLYWCLTALLHGESDDTRDMGVSVDHDRAHLGQVFVEQTSDDYGLNGSVRIGINERRIRPYWSDMPVLHECLSMFLGGLKDKPLTDTRNEPVDNMSWQQSQQATTGQEEETPTAVASSFDIPSVIVGKPVFDHHSWDELASQPVIDPFHTEPETDSTADASPHERNRLAAFLNVFTRMRRRVLASRQTTPADI